MEESNSENQKGEVLAYLIELIVDEFENEKNEYFKKLLEEDFFKVIKENRKIIYELLGDSFEDGQKNRFETIVLNDSYRKLKEGKGIMNDKEEFQKFCDDIDKDFMNNLQLDTENLKFFFKSLKESNAQEEIKKIQIQQLAKLYLLCKENSSVFSSLLNKIPSQIMNDFVKAVEKYGVPGRKYISHLWKVYPINLTIFNTDSQEQISLRLCSIDLIYDLINKITKTFNINCYLNQLTLNNNKEINIDDYSKCIGQLILEEEAKQRVTLNIKINKKNCLIYLENGEIRNDIKILMERFLKIYEEKKMYFKEIYPFEQEEKIKEISEALKNHKLNAISRETLFQILNILIGFIQENNPFLRNLIKENTPDYKFNVYLKKKGQNYSYFYENFTFSDQERNVKFIFFLNLVNIFYLFPEGTISYRNNFLIEKIQEIFSKINEDDFKFMDSLDTHVSFQVKTEILFYYLHYKFFVKNFEISSEPKKLKIISNQILENYMVNHFNNAQFFNLDNDVFFRFIVECFIIIKEINKRHEDKILSLFDNFKEKYNQKEFFKEIDILIEKLSKQKYIDIFLSCFAKIEKIWNNKNDYPNLKKHLEQFCISGNKFFDLYNIGNQYLLEKAKEVIIEKIGKEDDFSSTKYIIYFIGYYYFKENWSSLQLPKQIIEKIIRHLFQFFEKGNEKIFPQDTEIIISLLYLLSLNNIDLFNHHPFYTIYHYNLKSLCIKFLYNLYYFREFVKRFPNTKIAQRFNQISSLYYDPDEEEKVDSEKDIEFYFEEILNDLFSESKRENSIQFEEVISWNKEEKRVFIKVKKNEDKKQDHKNCEKNKNESTNNNFGLFIEEYHKNNKNFILSKIIFLEVESENTSKKALYYEQNIQIEGLNYEIQGLIGIDKERKTIGFFYHELSPCSNDNKYLKHDFLCDYLAKNFSKVIVIYERTSTMKKEKQKKEKRNFICFLQIIIKEICSNKKLVSAEIKNEIFDLFFRSSFRRLLLTERNQNQIILGKDFLDGYITYLQKYYIDKLNYRPIVKINDKTFKEIQDWFKKEKLGKQYNKNINEMFKKILSGK